MKALQGRNDIKKAIAKEYEAVLRYTAPESSVSSFEYHARRIHQLAFRAFLNQNVYDF